MGNIYYIMGKSASGKDTIFQTLKERLPQLKTLVLYTTRPIREGETEGVEYHFVTQNEMEHLVDLGKVIEFRTYDTVFGPWSYFTVDDGQIQLDKEDYLVIGTLESYVQMQDYFGRGTLVPLYIEVEDGLRLERALAREREEKEPKYQELCRRFLADCEDFKEEHLKQCGIEERYDNRDFEQCLERLITRIQLYI